MSKFSLAHFDVFIFLFVHETQDAFLFQNNIYNENVDNDEVLSKKDDQVIRVDDNVVLDEHEVINIDHDNVVISELVEVNDQLEAFIDQKDDQTISTSNANVIEINDDYEEIPSIESVRPNTSNLNESNEEEIVDQDQATIMGENEVKNILLDESVKLNDNYEPKVDILIIENDVIQEGVEEGVEEKEEEKLIENVVKNLKVDEYDDDDDVIVSPQSELSAENNPKKTGENVSTKDEVSV